jgi:SH3-like domain-containing protein
VLAGESARPLGTVARGHPDGHEGGRTGWRAWTHHGEPVAIGGLCWWRRRADAAGALAWVTPASGARCLALAAYVRNLDDVALNDLLVDLPVDRFDALLEAAFGPEGVAA